MVKKIIISLVLIIMAIGAAFFLYVSQTMKPVDNMIINKNIYIIRDGFVNLFLIKGESGYIAIDAGENPEAVHEGLDYYEIDPRSIHSIFLTHSDPDHSGGLSAFSESRIYIPELEEPMILGKDTRKIFGRKMSGVSPIAQMNYTLLSTGTKLEIDGISIQAVSAPGHTPGSTSYIINNTVAIVGDMAVVSGNNLAPLPGFINNNHKLAEKTARLFENQYGYLKIIATAHDGLLRK